MLEILIPSTQLPENQHYYSQALSTLGAFGVALQNYPAVDLFMRDLFKYLALSSKWSKHMGQAVAFTTGGLCSGVVNFWMNVELLDGFFKRFNSDYTYKNLHLTAWQKLQYFGGIFVFLVTGILFGLMAFTFAMHGPLATLSIAAGIFVAGIMTIQEIETWLDSYDHPSTVLKESLTLTQKIGKWCGHGIAVGNVFALSLLFTLSLAQSLIILHIAALPALITGAAVAFSFGAFTEYYFYNFYLANFCKNITKNCKDMMVIPQAWAGFLCVVINAFVNAALTYAGIALFPGLLLAANIVLPITVITSLAAASAFFAGSASLILGVAFWIRQSPAKKLTLIHEDSSTVSTKKISSAVELLEESITKVSTSSIFAKKEPFTKNSCEQSFHKALKFA